MGSTRAWLRSLPAGSIKSWEQLAHDFAKNFQTTFKRPASIEELRSCKQKYGESIRAYIQRWTILRNSAEDISEESAIDAFRRGPVSYTHLRAHETDSYLVCRLLLEKKNTQRHKSIR